MSSRGVDECQLTQNGNKDTIKMVYIGKTWAKLYKKYTKSCYFNKINLAVAENKQEVLYLLYNCHTFFPVSCNRMEKGR